MLHKEVLHLHRESTSFIASDDSLWSREDVDAVAISRFLNISSFDIDSLAWTRNTTERRDIESFANIVESNSNRTLIF